MPQYTYKCDECNEYDSIHYSISQYEQLNSDGLAVFCSNLHPMHRTYESFPFVMPMSDGFNPTVGKYVSGKRQFEEELKIASAQATERTGIEHNFKPVDLRDTKALGITEEGLAEANKVRHDRGDPPLVKSPNLDI